MSNSDISEIIEFTSKLLELHDRDEMRAKTYASSIFNLERFEGKLSDLTENQLLEIRGVGRLMAKNILEIVETGTLQELDNLIEITPVGIFEIFKIKGLGVKKIKVLWQNLQIESIDGLIKACENGSIEELKGFGKKTQDSILESIAFLKSQEGKLRINKAQELSLEILLLLKQSYPETEEVGQVTRFCEVVDNLKFLVLKDGFGGIKLNEEYFEQDLRNSSPAVWRGFYKKNQITIEIEKTNNRDYLVKKFISNSAEEHLKFQNKEGTTLLSHVNSQSFESEEQVYKSFGFNYIVPEMREGQNEFEWIEKHNNNDLISYTSLKGTVHNHSTYSDGKNTLTEMANFCKSIGLQYFGIADHSQSAQYAGGLKPEMIIKQHDEIERYNSINNNFKVLKGIESDILTNGDLDYEDEILKTFDYVVASVHSGLSMDIGKATSRLIKAIENPYTSILGHLSGRLLLSRNGYPLDYDKIIDACAANKVVMEFNASPYRLDIDWRHIEQCMNKGVLISINPDAHELNGIYDMKYGVSVARKAGLTKDMTLNTLDYKNIMHVFSKK